MLRFTFGVLTIPEPYARLPPGIKRQTLQRKNITDCNQTTATQICKGLKC